jgi:peptide deformylase
VAILKVAQMGHPVLREVARPVPVDVLRTPAFQQFLDDLLQTMEEYDGAGLAAPQVHVSVRAVVLVLDPEQGPEFLINPVIRPLSDVTTRTLEGCLSVEGLRGVVERPAHVRVDALDREGRPLAYELEGFPAVVVQHECDHLDGRLYLDRVDTRTLGFLEETERYVVAPKPALEARIRVMAPDPAVR